MPAVAPTIGRVVYYKPAQLELETTNIVQLSFSPFRADVAHVNPDGSVNLAVTDHAGISSPRFDVPFVQDGEDCPADRGYAYWMPYQVAQAAAAEAKVLQAAK